MDYSKLKQLAISESGFVFNPLTGDTYTINPTAVFLINELKKHGNVELAVDCLLENFEVDEMEAQKDVEGFVSQLDMYNLI